MVVDEVYCTLIVKSLVIVLSMNKIFLFHHLFNEDGEGPLEFFKYEKPNQMLLKFVPLCYLGICNLIVSLKHRSKNLGSLDCILKLKALFGYDYIFRTIVFLVNMLGIRFICSRCSSMELRPYLIWFGECN
jgi:hypothetical protein